VNVLAWDWTIESGSIKEPSSLGRAYSRTLRQGNALATALISTLGPTYNQSIHSHWAVIEAGG